MIKSVVFKHNETYQIADFDFVSVEGGLSDREIELVPVATNSISGDKKTEIVVYHKQNISEENLLDIDTNFQNSHANHFQKNIRVRKHQAFMSQFRPNKSLKKLKKHEDAFAPCFCTTCVQKFETGSDIHNDNRNSSLCEFCGKSFKCTSNLMSHIRTQHRASNQPICLTCEFCEKRFGSAGGLRAHVRVFHEGVRHLCEICGKEFSSPGSLQCHVRIHTGEKPFSCKYCPKAFTRKIALKVHERVHTKVKPHVCELCGNRYSQRSPLKLHIRAVHSGERPFCCTICQKKFVGKSLLNTHMKIHAKKGV